MTTSTSPSGFERPGVGALVIGLLVDAPIARGGARRVAALPGRLVIGGLARPRIAAGLDRVARLLDRADMRPDDAVDADIEHLLGDELVHLAAIGRDAHERRDGRREAARLQDLRAVEHVLHAVAQLPDVVGVVLHLEHDAVIGGGADRLRRADLGRRERDKGRLAAFERADRRVEARNVGHLGSSAMVGRLDWRSAGAGAIPPSRATLIK